MDEKRTEESTEEPKQAPGQGGVGGPHGAGEARDRKDFESRMDGYAERFSRVVSDGVKKLEDAFDKGKANLKDDIESNERRRLAGSPRLGIILLGAGLVWLLYTLGVLRQPIFPVLMVILGIYFLLRNK
jgi:hypothetical protein